MSTLSTPCSQFSFGSASRSRFLFLLSILFFAIGAAAEESTRGLEIETIAEIRRGNEKSVEFVIADELKIGEEIFYTLRVRNVGAVALDDAVVIKSLPRNTRYIADSAAGPAAKISFSVDGAKTFATAEQAIVVGPDGAVRAAMPSDYTHIRWQLRHPLAVGATALLRFRGEFK